MSSTFYVRQTEKRPISIPISDSAGDPLALAGYQVEFRAKRADTEIIKSTSDSTITISGAEAQLTLLPEDLEGPLGPYQVEIRISDADLDVVVWAGTMVLQPSISAPEPVEE